MPRDVRGVRARLQEHTRRPDLRGENSKRLRCAGARPHELPALVQPVLHDTTRTTVTTTITTTTTEKVTPVCDTMDTEACYNGAASLQKCGEALEDKKCPRLCHKCFGDCNVPDSTIGCGNPDDCNGPSATFYRRRCPVMCQTCIHTCDGQPDPPSCRPFDDVGVGGHHYSKKDCSTRFGTSNHLVWEHCPGLCNKCGVTPSGPSGKTTTKPDNSKGLPIGLVAGAGGGGFVLLLCIGVGIFMATRGGKSKGVSYTKFNDEDQQLRPAQSNIQQRQTQGYHDDEEEQEYDDNENEYDHNSPGQDIEYDEDNEYDDNARY